MPADTLPRSLSPGQIHLVKVRVSYLSQCSQMHITFLYPVLPTMYTRTITHQRHLCRLLGGDPRLPANTAARERCVCTMLKVVRNLLTGCQIRCSGYENSLDGKCQNCTRYNQQCLFHPVSSQAAFVPASAVYGPNVLAPVASQDGSSMNGYGSNVGQSSMLYVAHGQSLVRPVPRQLPYSYSPGPPQGYPRAHPDPPPHLPPQGHTCTDPGQASPQGHRASLKRHLDDADESQSPRRNSKSPHSPHDSRPNSDSSDGYARPWGHEPDSPAISIKRNLSFPQQPFGNGVGPPKDHVPLSTGVTLNSAHSFESLHNRSMHDEGKTGSLGVDSTGSSVRAIFSINSDERLGSPNHYWAHPEQRSKNDNDMLNKLCGRR